MVRRQRIIGVFLACSAALLILSAIAWACTPSAYLYPVSPSSGAAGMEVTVRGGQFGNGPVELRWAAENGRLLGTALGPDFTLKVRIPDKPQGAEYLVAVARDPADPSKILARRAESFQITSNPNSEARAAASLWSEARQLPAEEEGLPLAAAAAIGLGLAGTGAAAAALMVVRRKRAEA